MTGRIALGSDTFLVTTAGLDTSSPTGKSHNSLPASYGHTHMLANSYRLWLNKLVWTYSTSTSTGSNQNTITRPDEATALPLLNFE